MNNLSRGIVTHSYRHVILHFLIALSLVFACPLFAKAEECSSSIGDYIAIPPFLSSGVEGNLLLMLDNSGSMYDLAYVNVQEYCYDDTYNPAGVYAGYFDQDVWYYYDQATEQFEESAATACDAATGTKYSSSEVCITIDTSQKPDEVTAFAAKGNYLNWATASKLDIQKKILTGGKYEEAGTYGAPNDRLVMESRGCLDRRFVKQVPVTDSNSATFYLTLAIQPPGERFPVWENGIVYPSGSIVTDVGDFYKTTNGGSSNGTGVADDIGVTDWALHTHVIRWTSGTDYAANSIVSYDGKMYITADGGTAGGTSIHDDTGIDDWVSYNVTHMEIFPVTTGGFNNDPCQRAIAELQEKSPNQGQIKQDIEKCMLYSPSEQGLADKMNAFNHSLHNCWYYAKKSGTWPPGEGPVQTAKNDCQTIYKAGVDPGEITPDDMGYVCYGIYDDDPDKEPNPNQIGYVGRCWKTGANATCVCTHWKNPNACKPSVKPDPECCQKWECTGDETAGWVTDVDKCVEAALKDYCVMLEIPEVIDPSDQAGETGELWNIPAVLIDSGVTAQVGKPIAEFKVSIEQTEPPTGIIQEFAEDLRIGAMVFNDYGSKTECNNTAVDPHITYNCSDSHNRDGGQIISYIDDGAALTADGGNHTTELVSEINKIKATCWTPLAEAMYTAIGYYTQNAALRLDLDDFLMDGNHTDPVQFWCQTNNVLIITEGASTADRNPEVIDFIDVQTEDDNDTDLADCGSLDGSTYLDDLTYFAKHGDIYPAGNKQLNGEDKLNITTHIVAAGTLRSSGAGECSPDVLLEDAAYNGRVLESDPQPECGPGTGIPCLHQAADPSELERELRKIFMEIEEGAAAGSAASVISSSRAGEGVIYQAIFFPKDSDDLSGNETNWSGEVHALFVDAYGNMREDTNENDALDLDTDRFVVYYEEEIGKAKLCEPVDGSGKLLDKPDETYLVDVVDIMDLNYIWSTRDWLSNKDDMDVTTQRTYTSTDHKRYIFTDKIDTSQSVSMNNVDSTDVMDFTTDFVNDAANDNYYFLNPANPEVGLTENQMITEAQNIIRFVRGEEGLSETGTGTPYRPRTLDKDGDGTDEVYRLGDIIHSTPTVVSQPSEDYDLLYRDDSYRAFRKKYLNRRIVVYAGANDGMLHAFNGGFYDASTHKFYTKPPFTVLGSELWAYIPNALLPHLKWLKESLDDNTHVYYVDLKPRIFDARIFSDDTNHPGGWGTVLIGGMRFGGAPIGVDTTIDGDGDPAPDGKCDLNFQSTYFALDITNPEVAPNLLWSFSDDNLGFTTSYPTPIRVGSRWFVVIGSGPDNYDATRKDDGVHLTEYGGSNSTASVYILNADDGSLAREFSMDGHSFMAAPIAVDFDLATTLDGNDTLWTGEAIYIASDGCGA